MANTLIDRFRGLFTKPANGNGTKSFSWQMSPADFWPGSDHSPTTYAAAVGDGSQSSVVAACLNWLMRTFPEAPVVVERRLKLRWEIIQDDPLEALLDQPNPYYDGRVLWMATVMDFAFGEAFWMKVRDGLGNVKQLWWMPRALVNPRWEVGSRKFIDHYDYATSLGVFRLSPEDVVHFRFGMDPSNPRRGFSQLASVVREVYVDDQAATFTAALLRNLGIIGILVSPKEGPPPPEADVKALKAYLTQNFTGEKRGAPLVMSRPTDVQVMQYNLQGFDMGPIRDVSEERVCAALGLPAAVVGFGTGLQQTKVGATMREMIQLAWKGAVMPMQKIMAGELKRSLLSDFHANMSLFRVRFDASQVPLLWEDDAQKSERIVREVQGCVLTIGEGRTELGYAAEEAHNVFLRPNTVQAVAPEDLATPPPAPPAPPVVTPEVPNATPNPAQ